MPLKKQKKKGGGKKRKPKVVAAPTAAADDDKMRDGDASDGEDAEEEDSKPWEAAKEVAMEEDDPDDPEKTIPFARYNAMLAVQRNTLYMRVDGSLFVAREVVLTPNSQIRRDSRGRIDRVHPRRLSYSAARQARSIHVSEGMYHVRPIAFHPPQSRRY